MTKYLFAGCASALPVVHFGMQLALASFYPDYYFLHNPTSLLGIDGTATAPWFNALANIFGALALGGAAVIATGIHERPVAPWLVAVATMAIVAVGCGNIWAGTFPLPDPRRDENPFNLAFDAIPIMFAGAAWTTAALRRLRLHLTVNLVAYIAVKLVILGFIPIDPASCSGLLQRLAAATIFVPIGVIGWRQRGSAGRHEA